MMMSNTLLHDSLAEIHRTRKMILTTWEVKLTSVFVGLSICLTDCFILFSQLPGLLDYLKSLKKIKTPGLFLQCGGLGLG